MTKTDADTHAQLRGRAITSYDDAYRRYKAAHAKLKRYRETVKGAALDPSRWALRDNEWVPSASADPVRGWPSYDDVVAVLQEVEASGQDLAVAQEDLERLGMNPNAWAS